MKPRAQSEGFSASTRDTGTAITSDRDASGIHFDGVFDLVLAFWMLHEVPDQALMLGQVCRALKPGGRLFMVEPRGHVRAAAFDRALQIARNAGLTEVRRPRVSFSRAILMKLAPANTSTMPPK